MIIANTIFPDVKLQRRITDYVKFEKLLQGKHDEVYSSIYNNLFADEADVYTYQITNLCFLCSKVCSDFLFSEFPSITSDSPETAAELARIIDSNNLHTLFLELAMATSAYGDAYVKVFRREDLSVGVMPIKPYYVDMHESAISGDREFTVFSVERVNDKDILYTETHTAGEIITARFEYDEAGKKIGKPVDVEVIDTGISSPLVVHIPNIKLAGDVFGISDYVNLYAIQEGLNRRSTQISRVLTKHSSPILTLPESFADETGKIKLKDLEIVLLPDETDKSVQFNYLTWNAQLESAFNEVNSLIDRAILVADLPGTLLRADQIPSSGEALKLKLVRTMAMISRKQLYFTKAIKEMLNLIMELENESSMSYEIGNINVEWKDGLPSVEPALAVTPNQ